MKEQTPVAGVTVGNHVIWPGFSGTLKVVSTAHSVGDPKAMLKPVDGGNMMVAPIAELAPA